MMSESEAKEVVEAQAHLWKHTFQFITSMSLKCALELGIPDILSIHGKPLTLSELVKALSIPEMKTDHLFRLMRLLVHSGFFAIQDQGYVLTPSSKLLFNNHARNDSLLLLFTDPIMVTPFQLMNSWFRNTAEPTPFESAHGTDLWTYCRQHSHFCKTFNAAMASDAALLPKVVGNELTPMLEGFESLVDVGGGTGNMTKAISEAFAHMRCIVFDLPNVISNMRGSKNLEFVPGDMFKYIPSADIILLKWILHDWNDEDCVKILKNCKDAISTKRKRGKVIIIETVLDQNNGTHESVETQLCLDILMMTVAGGKERAEAEWEKLFTEAGFKSYKITHALGMRSIIEVFP